MLELSLDVVLNPLCAKGVVNRLEDWPWSSYLAMVGDTPRTEWLTTDWLLSLFGKRKKIAMERYQQFVLEGVQCQPEIWSSLKGQIYLGDEAFIAEIQKRIGEGKRRFKYTPAAKATDCKAFIQNCSATHKDRKTAIIAAYKTGAYSQ